MSNWQSICKVTDIDPNLPEAALFGTEQVAVVRAWDERIYVVSNVDPRTQQGVMSRGIVGDRDVEGARRATLASPIYKEVYDLETGKCYANDAYTLPVYASRVSDGVIEVDLDSKNPA
ncbi:nitrite reductase small subunit NirD [Dermabacter hominis]|uniref:nitrite reductase small subunit NirD n=1 Tax=Dermabacter hominis TaxID=36740 RepID=UPI0031836CA7